MITIIFLSALIITFLGGVVYFVIIFNGLKNLKNNIDKSLANIDVLLKQRFDEIPQLVKICKGYIGYESNVLKELTELRKRFEETRETISKEGLNHDLTTKIAGLSATAENYPELKASPQFLNLQTRVSDLEMEITDRREFYNDSVNSFNIRIESFPDMFVAKILGYEKQKLLKIEEGEREIPNIEVNTR